MNDKGPNIMELKDKYYFGAYLNMARHNVYLLVDDINTRLGFDQPRADDSKIITFPVFSRLKDGKAPDEQRRIIRELHRAFPFLKPMMFAYYKPMHHATEEEIQKMEYAPADYHTFFNTFLVAINKLRNTYTHVAPQTEHFEFPMNLLAGLRVTYDAAVRKAKTRFGFDPKEMEFLVRQGKLGKERPDFRYKFLDNTKNGLGIYYGLVFFTCLLLERKYASEFTQKIQGLKDRRKLDSRVWNYQATGEVFIIYSIRLPNVRHSSETGEGALLLDMLNELKKCPALLFEQLGENDQDRFRVKLKAGDTPTENIPQEYAQQDDSESTGHVLQKRYEDRFVYFALRFVDEARWFEKLRFPIDLGNYYHKLYDKIVDGEPRIRSLWEKIIAWGRLPYFEERFLRNDMPEQWKALLISPEEKNDKRKEPYIVRTLPHYHLDGDNIAIKLMTDDNSKYTDAWPDPVAALPKAGKPGHNKADFYLSKYELFSFIFYGLLLGASRVKELEDSLLRYKQRRYKLYRDIADGTLPPMALPTDMQQPDYKGIKPAGYTQRKKQLDELLRPYDCTTEQIPREIMNYLLGVETESFKVKAKYRLEDLRGQTEDLLYKLTRNLREKRKPGSKKDVEIKSGKLADFLAKDILMFQPPLEGAKEGGKATSLLYSVMQSKLALYGAHHTTLRNTFIECGLLHGPNQHPFLSKVVDQGYKKIVDFYKGYLKERLVYLDQCERMEDYTSHRWLRHNQARRKNNTDYGRQLTQRMLDIPVVIPRGFFTDKIKTELTGMDKPELKQLLPVDIRVNASYMLQAYLQHVKADTVQDFYNWPREYKIFSDCYTQKKEKSDVRIPYPLNEMQRKEKFMAMKAWAEKNTTGKDGDADYIKRFADFEWTEKQIRQVKAQDIVIFGMCEYLMKHVNPNLINMEAIMYLRDISPDAERGILNQFTKLKRTVTYPKNGTGHLCVIVQESIKVKNVGDFNRFMKDRRLLTLLSYIDKAQVTRQELEEELKDYDNRRVEIFKMIHQFEERLIRENVVSNKLSFESFMDSLKQAGRADDETIERIKNIRNKFSHNEFPDVKLFPELVGRGKIAQHFLEYLQKTL